MRIPSRQPRISNSNGVEIMSDNLFEQHIMFLKSFLEASNSPRKNGSRLIWWKRSGFIFLKKLKIIKEDANC